MFSAALTPRQILHRETKGVRLAFSLLFLPNANFCCSQRRRRSLFLRTVRSLTPPGYINRPFFRYIILLFALSRVFISIPEVTHSNQTPNLPRPFGHAQIAHCITSCAATSAMNWKRNSFTATKMLLICGCVSDFFFFQWIHKLHLSFLKHKKWRTVLNINNAN